MSALEDEYEIPQVMANIDGVPANSEVRRQVLRQISHFKNVLRNYNPDNFTPAALARNKTLWMSEFHEKFDNLVDALIVIESLILTPTRRVLRMSTG